ncbi:MAG: SH3 domain-containing protein [Sphingomonas sp.]
MRIWSWLVFGAAAIMLVLAATEHASAQHQQLPYYESIKPNRARMRAGPGRNYPATWLYVRAGLPIKVIAVYKNWKKIEDPDGTQGWFLDALLSSRRTAMVTGGIAAMRDTRDFDGHVSWRAAPGVIGRISDCSGGWCWFDVNGKGGYVEETQLWGVDPGEQVD